MKSNLWWQQRWVLTALVLATALPIMMVTLPPLTDYFGHMGRYRVQLDLASSPLLQRNWDFHWALIANLGVDLLMEPLSRIFGLERSIWIIGFALPPFLAWGLLRTAKAVHGSLPATALAVLPFATAFPYQYGFVNFWLGLGLAFHIFAFWVGVDNRRFSHALAFGLASLCLWVCHIYAWAVLCVLVGCFELYRGWQKGERNLFKLISLGVARSWPFMLPFALMIAWSTATAGTTTFGWFRWTYKLVSFFSALRDQNAWIDCGVVVGALMLFCFGLRGQRGRVHPALALATLVLFLCAVILPYQLLGSCYADSRMWPVVLMVAILSVRIEPMSSKTAQTIALIAATVFLVRVGFATVGYAQYERANAQHLKALNYIPMGSRVAILARSPCTPRWRLLRIENLGSVALLRRDAFVNAQWVAPGAQLLTPLGAIGTPYNAAPSHIVVGDDCDSDMHKEFGREIIKMPRDRFDFVWLFDVGTTPPPSFPGLGLLYADDRTMLFRIYKGDQR
jgi:hypothetical protein